ncbi:type II toxin-antitoxin system RelE/ParE family toxin [Methylophilus sp. 5]|uniref:type II toxin-antitoxin system RelE/ParE family toxin n=1 Tax=Methylophilus sp. 5 TaxID=1112274 RepID=UPI001E502D4D|nr:type II toxin-antitoxin system RelE/ParE family toxin [Methylophilus sp. 5]
MNAQHAHKLKLILSAMHVAEQADDLRAPASWRLHTLSGRYVGYWSLTVNGNWRVIFKFVGNDIELVDYLDYH